MPTCDVCDKEITMPYTCRYCGGSFCGNHRLPENHDCEGLDEFTKKTQEEGRVYWGTGDETKRGPEKTPNQINFRIGGTPDSDKTPRKPESSSPFSGTSLLKLFFLQNTTMILLLVMFLAYIGQLIAQGVLGSSYYTPKNYDTFLYYVAPAGETMLSRPWTLLTSIFIHGGPVHLFINGMVLFFLGPALERRIKTHEFIYLFLGAGILAAIAQVVASPAYIIVLGASGAILGVLGALTILAPNLPILLFFFIPMKLWMLTLGYGALSVISHFAGFFPRFGHMAHFAGIIVGVIYGYKLKREGRGRLRHPLQEFMRGFS